MQVLSMSSVKLRILAPISAAWEQIEAGDKPPLTV